MDPERKKYIDENPNARVVMADGSEMTAYEWASRVYKRDCIDPARECPMMVTVWHGTTVSTPEYCFTPLGAHWAREHFADDSDILTISYTTEDDKLWFIERDVLDV